MSIFPVATLQLNFLPSRNRAWLPPANPRAWELSQQGGPGCSPEAYVRHPCPAEAGMCGQGLTAVPGLSAPHMGAPEPAEGVI